MKNLTLLITLLCFTSIFGHENEGREATVITTEKGDIITMGPVTDREVRIGDKTITKVIGKPQPVLVNGKEIFYFKRHPDWKKHIGESDAFKKSYEDYEQLNSLLDEVTADAQQTLPPGKYKFSMKNLVVGDDGSFVYYETNGFTKYEYGATTYANHITLDMNKYQAEILNNIITAQLKEAKVTPLLIDNEPTPYLTAHTYYIQIKE